MEKKKYIGISIEVVEIKTDCILDSGDKEPEKWTPWQPI